MEIFMSQVSNTASQPHHSFMDVQGHDKEPKIEKLHFPKISSSAAAIFKESSHIQIPATYGGLMGSSLQDKVSTLETTINRLSDKKNSFKTEKIESLFEAAVYTAVIAGAILGTVALAIFCPPAAAVVLGCATLGGMLIFGRFHDRAMGFDDIRLTLASFLAYPILAIYEGFVLNKKEIERLEKSVEGQEAKIKQEIDIIVKFFDSNFEPVRKDIDQKIQAARADLKASETMTTEDVPKIIKERLKTLEKALVELDQAHEHYKEGQQ